MRFKEIRLKVGMSVKDVAKKLAISENTVWRWELGTRSPSLEQIKNLACLYGCTTDELLGMASVK